MLRRQRVGADRASVLILPRWHELTNTSVFAFAARVFAAIAFVVRFVGRRSDGLDGVSLNNSGSGAMTGALKLTHSAGQLRATRVRIATALDAKRDRSLFSRWEQLLHQHPGTTLFYQSPEYFDHLGTLHSGTAFLAVLEASDGTPVGVFPLRKSPVLLKFEVRNRNLCDTSFTGIEILGGTPLAPQSRETFELLFREIARVFNDCEAIELKRIPARSALWEFLQSSETLKRQFLVYAPNGPRHYHSAVIPESFEKYLEHFPGKKQYNLKRQIRRLDEFGQGSLKLHRVGSPDEVDFFHKAWVALDGPLRADETRLSEAETRDLAERGLALSYVLTVNGQPCALAAGSRFRDTLIVHTFRHDKELARFSPGTVLQVLMIKDLIEHKLADRIDYGFGEPRYRLTNEIDERVNAIVLRKGLRSRSVIASHMSYLWLVDKAKRLMSARAARRRPNAEPESARS